MFVFQRHIIFPRHYAIPVPEVAEKISNLEKIWLDLNFGKVESWFLTPVSTGKKSPVLIFAHGNAELIEHWAEFFLPLTRLGIGIYLVEYPGYGRSQGLPSQRAIVETFVAAHDLIIDRPDVDPEKVVFLGRSIGGGAVCALVEKRKPAALILMSTFTSVSSMARKFGVPGLFIRDPLDNLNTVKSFEGPLLVIHGKDDEIIPYSHGVKLSKASPHGQLITYECGHNDCPPNWDVFYHDVVTFLKSSNIHEVPKIP
jgi:pimeloyl-ACP methyl ester carboxylesterase